MKNNLLLHLIFLFATIFGTIVYAQPECQSLLKNSPLHSPESWVQFDSYLPTFGSLALQLTHNFIASEVTLKNRPNEKIGRFQASWDEKNRILEINLIRIEDAYQGKGLSTYIFKKLLELIPPQEINRVTATLAFDNKKVFLETWGKTQGDLALALQSTPFYKSFSSLGFSEVLLSESVYQADIGLIRIALYRTGATISPIKKESFLILSP